MAVGKNKKLGKAKKAGKKKAVDPFTRKEWYDIKVPALFDNRVAGKTPVNKTAGTKVSSEMLKGRVFEISLGDLNKDSAQSDFRKMRLIVEEVQGKAALCNFYGMDVTRDKLASLLRKWRSLVESSVDVRTADGYLIRLFAIGLTARAKNQTKKTNYAQTSQVRAIRKKMADIMTAEATKSDLKDLMKKIIPEAIGQAIEKACKGIYPVENVLIRKMKILKSPKFDLTRLMEVHGDAGEDAGATVKRAAPEGAVAELAGSGGRL